jgi:hypothetical protein
MEILENEVGGDHALTGEACSHSLKEYADRSHTLGMTSCNNSGKNSRDTRAEGGAKNLLSQMGQAISKEAKGKVVRAPSSSTPLFRLDGSPSSDSKDIEGLKGTLTVSGHPIAAQPRMDLLLNGLPPTSGNADLSPLAGTSAYVPKAPFCTSSFHEEPTSRSKLTYERPIASSSSSCEEEVLN